MCARAGEKSPMCKRLGFYLDTARGRETAKKYRMYLGRRVGRSSKHGRAGVADKKVSGNGRGNQRR